MMVASACLALRPRGPRHLNAAAHAGARPPSADKSVTRVMSLLVFDELKFKLLSWRASVTRALSLLVFDER